MSHQLSRDHYKQPSPSAPSPPLALNSHRCSSNPSALRHLHHPIHNFEPPPTLNMQIGMLRHGGARAYFRFHGGIGDGCSRRACKEDTAARPLQLFDALNPAQFQNELLNQAREGGGFVNPVTGACGGTGVFFPVYSRRKNKGRGRKNNGGMIVDDHGQHQRECNNNSGMKKEQENPEKYVAEQKEFDEIPIELLLPAEWTY